MKAWIKLTLVGIAGGVILLAVITVAFGLGFGVEFEGEGETITYVDHPPITFDDALTAVGEGQVTEVVVYDSLNPVDENWYEYESGSGVARWQAEDLQVWVQRVGEAEPRAIFSPDGETIGLESFELQGLMRAARARNENSKVKITISDFRPAR